MSEPNGTLKLVAEIAARQSELEAAIVLIAEALASASPDRASALFEIQVRLLAMLNKDEGTGLMRTISNQLAELEHL
jgi:hypothetical protein